MTPDVKRGDLVLVFDPVRPTGSGSGTRGLFVARSVADNGLQVGPLDRDHFHERIGIPLEAVHAVYPANFVLEALIR